MAIFADPTDPNRVYAPNVDAMYVSTDGGKTWAGRPATPHGDHHIIWINPNHPNILLEGNDGGATVSVNRRRHLEHARTISRPDRSTTSRSTISFRSMFSARRKTKARGKYASAFVGGSIPPIGDWHTVALGESTFIAPDPDNPLVTFGSGYYSYVRATQSA